MTVLERRLRVTGTVLAQTSMHQLILSGLCPLLETVRTDRSVIIPSPRLASAGGDNGSRQFNNPWS
jgi:hypothetical protein